MDSSSDQPDNGPPLALSAIFSPPTQQSLADGVVAHLRDAILSGRLAPGERLQEEALARSMPVSRGPIREALKQLEREGLVIMRRNRGAYVARLSRTDLEEVYSLRLALERLAVQLAVRNADPAYLSELQALVDAMKACADQGITEQESADLDIRFHEIIYKASKHTRLYDSWTELRPQVVILLLGRNIAELNFHDQVIKGHQEIVDALQRRDEQAAVAVIEDHLRTSYNRVMAGYLARNTDLSRK